MEKSTLVKVLNRDNGAVGYCIPEMNGLRRVFQAGEIKEITFEELQKLSYIPGGMALLRENLVIIDQPRAVEELLGRVEPEYNYTRDDVIKLLREGSLDEFLDCLDFAPEGVKELVKTLSVQLPLNDVAKREAILNKLGFSVDVALRLQKEANEAESAEEQAKPSRRVQKTQEKPATTSRRVVK